MIYQQLINGLMLGASYSLVAIGYTLIFGVLNLLYFAHGEVFMVGAFVGLYLVVYGGANIYVALAGATIACGALGIVAFYVAVRPVPKDRPLAPLISTIGLTIVLQNLAVYIFGGQQVAFPETIRQELYHLGSVTISSVQIFILAVAVAAMAGLWLFIERTKLGLIEILSAAYIGTTERDLFSFLILILILLYRPTGLFGTRTADER